jgi:hypothetical protein
MGAYPERLNVFIHCWDLIACRAGEWNEAAGGVSPALSKEANYKAAPFMQDWAHSYFIRAKSRTGSDVFTVSDPRVT